MRWLALALALVLLPCLASAKGKVVLDAPKPLVAPIEKAIKGKYTVKQAQLASEPTGGDVKNACREAGAVAVITVRLAGSEIYTVMVLNGADGSPLATFRVKSGKKPLKALAKPDAKKLLEGLDDAKPPKKEEAKPPPPEEAKPPPPEEKKPEPAAEKPPEEKPKKDKERPKPTEPPPPPKEEVRVTEEEPPPRPSTKGPMKLRLGVDFKVFRRIFGYTDDIFNALSTYYLPFGPAIGADLEVYPAAFIMRGFAANIGLLAQFDYAVGISSKADDGTKFATTALNVRASLTVRIPVSVLTVSPFFGYSLQTYAIGSAAGTAPNIPSVGYSGLRGGLLLKVAIAGPVGMQLHFAGQYLLSKGPISTFFPHASANGLDAGGALVIGLFDRLEVKLGYEYQRYWYSMNPAVGDDHVAGGALDIYGSGYASIAFTL